MTALVLLWFPAYMLGVWICSRWFPFEESPMALVWPLVLMILAGFWLGDIWDKL